MEYVGTHERENRHDVVKDRIGRESSQTCHEKECLVECLRVFRDFDDVFSQNKNSEG